jgi:ankyrin repeat protein
MPRGSTAGVIDAHDNGGMTHLVSSINKGRIAAAHWALERGADVEEKCYGKTPLLYAVERKDTTMVQVLRHYRPNVNLDARDNKGKPAIAIAAEQGDSMMIDTLLNFGANIESTSPGQVTPLMIAAQFGQLEAVKALIRGLADCIATDQEGWSALHHAVHGPDHQNVQEIIQYLINHELDVNARCRGDVTPLHMAVTDQKMFAIGTLLENNADLTAKDSGGHTCLHVAVEENYTDLVVLLVNKGAMWEGKIPRDVSPGIKDILKRNVAGVDLALERKDSAISSRSRRFRLGSLHLPGGKSK